MPVPRRAGPPPIPLPVLLELQAIYARAERELAALVADPLRQTSAPATTEYRRQRLREVRAILARLDRQAVPLAVAAVATAAAQGAALVDRAVGLPVVPAPAFGGVLQGQARVLAAALADSLDEAHRTVGRSARDALRRATLEAVAQQAVQADTRRDSTRRLASRLRDLSHDGVTALVDARGARWRISTYAAMATVTTAREAASAATMARMLTLGLRVVSISSHRNPCREHCVRYDGGTFALPGRADDRYETIDRLPPFHPWCRHVAFPAAVALDDYEAELERRELAGR